MDKEAIELGGKAKFFSNYTIPDPKDPAKKIVVEFEKYSWDNLFDTKVTATAMLTLYSEAIVGMDKNPNIPQLFRDIFKNAYLPYRDPETLKMFLKTISEFEYTHSEKLGDAFEYLLSVMGSQGDAGQFRTPRHIIDFMVAVVDPTISDTILDPACGTAGFLISAFKHVKEKNKNGLTPDERKKLIRNFTGYDISPDMVRLSLVNLYLHGFSDPHIWEYDTLSSEDRWKENFDVILANPPFMSPKGGIRPHKKFSISSNRSEVLFVDYIAEHLNSKGRAGIIVPEGVIFQSGTAYKDLRKMLVDNYLYAVVSLPAGVFNPYSGVKTSILLMDKEFAKTSDKILFVKVANDGYGLGAQRNAVKGGQLDDAIDILKQFKTGTFSISEIAHSILKEEIAENGDYNLSGERYKVTNKKQNSQFVPLSDLCELVRGVTYNKEDEVDDDGYRILRANNIKLDSSRVDFTDIKQISKKLKLLDKQKLKAKDIFICTASGSADHIGKTAFIDKDIDYYFGGFMGVIRCNNNVIPEFLFQNLRGERFNTYLNSIIAGANIKNLKAEFLYSFKIPLPPLSIQQEIVAEIEAYQKIIDGAKMVVENYKPKIDIDPEWELVELGGFVKIQTGGTPSKANDNFWIGDIPWISPKDMKKDFIDDSEDHINKNAIDNSSTKLVSENTVLIVVRSGILQHTMPIALTTKTVSFNQDIIAISPNEKYLIPKYLFYYLKSTSNIHIRDGIKPGVTVQSFHNGYFKTLSFPLPTLEIQHKIVHQLEKEQVLVDANKQLVDIFEQKIKDRISKVWEEK
jgi:type I restriction enzyme M protein